MKHATLPLFAIPVTHVEIDCDGIAEFFDTVVKQSKGRSNTDGTPGYRTPLVSYPRERNAFEAYAELKGLRERLLAAANFVYQEVLNHDTELRITNAWFNECEVGGRQLMHNHCNSVLSGTLYLRADQHSYLQFQSPYGLNDFGNLLLDEPNIRRPNKFGYTHHFPVASYKVSPGVCLLWPSHLRHGYDENRTPGRLSLSFNLLPATFNCLYRV
jgi:uncharacterized protein (TIGR02466 family)